jgi:hypothetical protein
VRDGRILLIDTAFAQVRPSPWRQAVDLANMMLVLAVRTDARRVYTRALSFFTPDDIAEAFAAARGVASPTQLRAMMKQDGRDLLSEFRSLAPHRRPISLQRWGPRRVVYVLALLLAAILDVRPRCRGHADLRHGERDDPHGSVGAVVHGRPVHRSAARRMDAGRREDPERSRPVLARLR